MVTVASQDITGAIIFVKFNPPLNFSFFEKKLQILKRLERVITMSDELMTIITISSHI